MIYGCLEEHGWWSIRVRGGELEGELQCQAGVWSSVRSKDCGSPEEEVLWIVREGGDAWCAGHHQLHQFGLKAVKALVSHCDSSGIARWFLTALPLCDALSILSTSSDIEFSGLVHGRCTGSGVLGILHGVIHGAEEVG